MHSTFLSIVAVVNSPSETGRLADWLNGIFTEVDPKFSDWEIVLVNNCRDQSGIEKVVAPLAAELRKNIFLLNLSAPVNRNHAILAGLDRANGDWTAIFEPQFADRPQLITELFEKGQAGADIIHLRGPAGETGLFPGIFHSILKKSGRLALDERAHDTRLISRRALNSLLRLREDVRYMKALYPLVGYSTAAIDVPDAVEGQGGPLRERVRTGLVAITSYTTFLRTVMGWMFVFSVLTAAAAIFNAVKVKLTSVDIFGERVESLSGWAFLVVLISVFFAITCLNLYIIGTYLSNIYQEMKGRPPYIIESTKRF